MINVTVTMLQLLSCTGEKKINHRVFAHFEQSVLPRGIERYQVFTNLKEDIVAYSYLEVALGLLYQTRGMSLFDSHAIYSGYYWCPFF